VARKFAELPTMRVEPAKLAVYARKADKQVREGRSPSAPDIEISVEYLDDPPTAVRNQSTVRPAPRSIEGATLEAVPVIAVTKEDLAWFELDLDAHAVLAVLDGMTSIEEVLAMVAFPPEQTMQILRELESQRVIALA
jgi:hypothetical protein